MSEGRADFVGASNDGLWICGYRCYDVINCN